MGEKSNAEEKPPRHMAEIVVTMLEKTGVPNAINPPASAFGEAATPGGKAIGETFSAVAVLSRDVVVGSIAFLTFGWERIRDFVMEDLPKRLRSVPNERLTLPRPIVAVPALEAIRLVGGEPELRAMYANLLASSMDSLTADYAHPAFVEIIRQMVPEEARLFEHLARVEWVPAVTLSTQIQVNPPTYNVTDVGYVTSLSEDVGISVDRIGTYLNNVMRLGLASVHRDHAIDPPSVYDRLLAKETVRRFEEQMKREHKTPKISRHTIGLTNMGRQFARVCLSDPSSSASGAIHSAEKASPESVS